MLFVQNVDSNLFYKDLTTTLYQMFNSAIPVKNVKWIGTVKLLNANQNSNGTSNRNTKRLSKKLPKNVDLTQSQLKNYSAS